jgi:hypothetical protein
MPYKIHLKITPTKPGERSKDQGARGEASSGKDQ